MTRRHPASAFCVSTVDGRLQPAFDPASGQFKLSGFEIGAIVAGRYCLQSTIGQGGMGQVFLAIDEKLGSRAVAIKVVSYKRVDKQGFYQTMLFREAELGANLNHPGIATVHDFGVQADQPYIVFEYVDGDNLRTTLEKQGRLGLIETRTIIAKLARALDFAHGQGIVHRDLKPENISRANNGEWKILDLGVAFDFSDGNDECRYAGTPAYSAPEQASGRPTDGRTDQYALACIAYELLTGRRVFEGETHREFLDRHVSDSPQPPSILQPELPDQVDAAILRALQKAPDQRFATCQEFAEALGCDQEQDFFRHLSQVPEMELLSFFICHSMENSIFARNLAQHLESLGYRTWYYQRDALPGLSLLAQTDAAIRRSAASIVLISRSSIESVDLAREMQQAHRIGCALIPVLIDLSLQEFESLQPAWRTILGPIAKIEVTRSDAKTLSDRIHRAAATKKIRIQRPTGVDTQLNRPLISGQIWATDAYQIDISELDSVVYETDIIREFLHRRNKCIVSATKGLGKTLLLTYKRLRLTKEFQSAGAQITMVPQGRPFLDFMGELRFLSKKYEAPLSELTNAKRLWSTALRISAISYQDDLIGPDEEFELKPFGQRIRRWLAGNRVEPTIVFKELTSLTVSEFNRLIDETEGFLDQKLRQVHQPIFFFIDKVDQAIRNLGSAAWVNVQAGLVEAAWDLMNANSHIKVFTSIRHEAYSNYESDIKSNLRGAVTILRYSEDELAQMLDRLSQCYEGARSFKDFVGLNVVSNTRRLTLEDSFQMIRRYTFGRPRDLVAVASEMSSIQSSLTEKKFCETVREFSATGLIPSIFDESRIFMDSLRDRESRVRFLGSIPSNILSKQQTLKLTAIFNGLPADSFNQLEPIVGLQLPFRDLYVAGVLGVILADADGQLRQHFRQPDDLISHDDFALPESSFYLIHPALGGYIVKTRATNDFFVMNQIPVGHRLPWRSWFELICHVEQKLLKIADERFVDRAHEVMQRYQIAARSRSAESVERIQTSADWKWLNQNAVQFEQEDVVHWLNELLVGVTH
jgi:serine/threonine protein kinase